MNTTPNGREAAAQFLADHDRLQKENADLTKRLSASQVECDRLIASNSQLQEMHASRDDYWISELRNSNRQKMLYLRYSVELSAQLQFVIAGCTRALKLAATVQALYDEQSDAGLIPAIPEADVKELESIMSRIAARAPRVDAMIKEQQPPAPPSDNHPQPPGIKPGTPPAIEPPETMVGPSPIVPPRNKMK